MLNLTGTFFKLIINKVAYKDLILTKITGEGGIMAPIYILYNNIY